MWGSCISVGMRRRYWSCAGRPNLSRGTPSGGLTSLQNDSDAGQRGEEARKLHKIRDEIAISLKFGKTPIVTGKDGSALHPWAWPAYVTALAS
jgi:hypothetical protein